MITSISREYWFSAAHRLEGHPKCGRLHGHNYRVVVTLFGVPRSNGMLMDYGDLDQIVKPIIDGDLDHKYLISRQNEDAQDPYAQMANTLGHGHFLETNVSTAECIAEYLYRRIDEAFTQGSFATITGLQVRVDETHKSTAAYPVRV